MTDYKNLLRTIDHKHTHADRCEICDKIEAMTQKQAKKECEKIGICKCGRLLPQPVLEDRGQSHSELITYCQCGRTYNG